MRPGRFSERFLDDHKASLTKLCLPVVLEWSGAFWVPRIFLDVSSNGVVLLLEAIIVDMICGITVKPRHIDVLISSRKYEYA